MKELKVKLKNLIFICILIIIIFLVAMQCISEAFGLEESFIASTSSIDLLQLIKGTKSSSAASSSSSTENLAEAEREKARGNEFIAANKPELAVECYDKAISLDSSNAVYFSNRAAAYSMMNEHFKALDDAKEACKLNPSYSKAFNRLGKAQMALGEPEDAVISFQKALDLEPTDASIKASLQAAIRASSHDSKLSATSGSEEAKAAPLWNDPGAGGFDFSSMLKNPQLMAMAQQMMQGDAMKDILKDPKASNVLESLMKNPDLMKSFTGRQ